MKPVVKPALQLSWITFGATALVCVVFLALWYDWGEAADRVEQAELAYLQRQGDLDLEQQVNAQRLANKDLSEHIEAIKDQTGVREVPPFVVPEGYRSPSEYFRVVYDKIREDLLQRASRRGSEGYEQDLGFGFLAGQLPDPELVDTWLLMLQLTTKAGYLALSSPHNTLHNITVADLGAGYQPVLAGPEGRPPLLREYRFTLEVDGSLHDVLWLLHQLSAETQTPSHREMQRWLSGQGGVSDQVYDALFGDAKQPPPGEVAVSPLVVLGLDIDSENLNPEQQVQTLHATFHLAGMEFLSMEERELSPTQPVVSTSAGVSGGGGAPRKLVARP